MTRLAISTSIPDAKQLILDRLRERPALEGVDLCWDLDEVPTDGELTGSWIAWIDGRSRQQLVGVRRSGNARDEQLTLRMAVYHLAGGDARETELAAWALTDQIEDTVRTDSRLAGLLGQLAAVSGVGHVAFRRSSGLWEQRIELEITCPHARLRP
jgi:hypothetical protein